MGTASTHHGGTFAYTYDLTDQLTGSTRDAFGPKSFSYDANGNRNSSDYTVGTGNQILSDLEFDYKYDNEGNLILKTSRATGNFTAYEFDHRNRLVKVEERTSDDTLVNEAYYLYDAKDRRISTVVNRTVTYHVYDNDNVWADFDGDANLETSYLFGKEIDSIFARSRPGQDTVWYLKDRLGTVRDLADNSGNVINHIDYNSFGAVIDQTNPDQGDRFMFTSREYEPVFNMYYYRARYYSPDLGRFMSQDPLGFDAGDFNLYRYINNNPLNGIDPDGRISILTYGMLLKISLCLYSIVQLAYTIYKMYKNLLDIDPFDAVGDVAGYGTACILPLWI